MTKSERYWSDGEAVRERYEKPLDRWGGQELKTPVEGFDMRDGDPYASAKRDRDMRPNPSGRNLRNVWTFATQPYAEAHFATFPEELPRRCILAGCPEKTCAKCGAGWVRILETTRENKSYWAQQGKTIEDTAGLGKYANRDEGGNPAEKTHDIRLGPTVSNKTLGWKPACDCGTTEETGKGVCLDPFSGSGTVVDVAIRAARIGIGVELSRKYLKLAMKRTENSRKQGVLI